MPNVRVGNDVHYCTLSNNDIANDLGLSILGMLESKALQSKLSELEKKKNNEVTEDTFDDALHAIRYDQQVLQQAILEQLRNKNQNKLVGLAQKKLIDNLNDERLTAILMNVFFTYYYSEVVKEKLRDGFNHDYRVQTRNSSRFQIELKNTIQTHYREFHDLTNGIVDQQIPIYITRAESICSYSGIYLSRKLQDKAMIKRFACYREKAAIIFSNKSLLKNCINALLLYMEKSIEQEKDEGNGFTLLAEAYDCAVNSSLLLHYRPRIPYSVMTALMHLYKQTFQLYTRCQNMHEILPTKLILSYNSKEQANQIMWLYIEEMSNQFEESFMRPTTPDQGIIFQPETWDQHIRKTLDNIDCKNCSAENTNNLNYDRTDARERFKN